MTNKHLNHKIIIENHDYHNGKMICQDCNEYIKWANDLEIYVYRHVYKNDMTYQDFLNHVHNTLTKGSNNIYLAVSYKEKDIAKKNGARWDPIEKLWYVDFYDKKATKLKQYMLQDDIDRLEKLEKYNRVYGE